MTNLIITRLLMHKKNKWLATFLIILLLTGLYIIYHLQQGFLEHFGFTKSFAIISVLFWDIMKLLMEFLFFRLKGMRKVVIGVLALIILSGSLLSVYSLRIYYSELKFNNATYINKINCTIFRPKNKIGTLPSN